MGVFVASVQFVVIKSGFSCSMKSAEGTVHERMTLVAEGAMPNRGAGVDCVVQMPPPSTTATSFVPSAEEATEDQLVTGALVCTQVAPEFVEM